MCKDRLVILTDPPDNHKTLYAIKEHSVNETSRSEDQDRTKRIADLESWQTPDEIRGFASLVAALWLGL